MAELKEEIVQLKVEHPQAQAHRKAKLQARIDGLSAKLQARLDQAKQRSEQIKAETEAKVQALQNRAAKAQGPLSDASRRPTHLPFATMFVIVINVCVFVCKLMGGDAFVPDSPCRLVFQGV